MLSTTEDMPILAETDTPLSLVDSCRRALQKQARPVDISNIPRHLDVYNTCYPLLNTGEVLYHMESSCSRYLVSCTKSIPYREYSRYIHTGCDETNEHTNSLHMEQQHYSTKDDACIKKQTSLCADGFIPRFEYHHHLDQAVSINTRQKTL